MKKGARTVASIGDSLEQSPTTLHQSSENKRTKDKRKAEDHQRKISTVKHRGLKRKCRERMRSFENCEEEENENESDWNSDEEMTGCRTKRPRTILPIPSPPTLSYRSTIQPLEPACPSSLPVTDQIQSAQTISMDRLYEILAEQKVVAKTKEEMEHQSSRSKLRQTEMKIVTKELRKIKDNVHGKQNLRRGMEDRHEKMNRKESKYPLFSVHTALQMSETPGRSVRVVKLATNRVSMGGSTNEKGTNQVEVKEEPIDDNEETVEKELYYVCSVDLCRKAIPASKAEFLPQDNIQDGIKMIIRSKTSIYDQNFLIQRYLEGHHLANRPDYINVSWARSIPFRACPRHFDRSKKLAFFLPVQMGQSWRNYHELILREGLFYMYGVGLRVDYFFDTRAASNKFNFGCVIPGCPSNPLKLTTNGLPIVKLFLMPVNKGLQSEWAKSIRDEHTKLYGFTPRLPVGSVVCEKHFVNGGKIVNGKMELPTLFHDSRNPHAAIQVPPSSTRAMFGIGNANTGGTDYCLVRCCPINTNSMKNGRLGKYVMYEVPEGLQGRKWLAALHDADPRLQIKADFTLFVCERHFAGNPNITCEIPRYFLTPPKATMSSRTGTTVKETLRKDDPCPCCNDVEICHSILRRFNAKMNTLMQHVNMLCVLEGVKEVIPRHFDDGADDLELYRDTEKATHLADIRAASMLVREAKGELSAVKGAINNMSQYTPRRTCALLSCCYSRNPKRTYRLVDTDTFEDDLMNGELLISQDRDCASIRRVLAKDGQVALCERHWKSHISNISVEFDEDSEDVRKLKEALALPVDFQPKFKKRRTEELEDAGQGTSAVVKVEVNDDEEEDERLLSNNELLQRLLGGAIAGQVTGEIGDNGEVFEGGEGGEEEMDDLDNHEPHGEDGNVDEEEEGPPELD